MPAGSESRSEVSRQGLRGTEPDVEWRPMIGDNMVCRSEYLLASSGCVEEASSSLQGVAWPDGTQHSYKSTQPVNVCYSEAERREKG